jgi:5-methylcytosine-specific restriction endonuclease McrA
MLTGCKRVNRQDKPAIMKANRRTQTEFVNYEKYINSKEWRDVRDKYFSSNMPQKCMACNKQKQKGFHIHHATYKRLGMEYLSDLRLLCPECHQGIHDLQKATGLKLLSATNRFIKETRKSLGLNPDVYRDKSKGRIE